MAQRRKTSIRNVVVIVEIINIQKSVVYMYEAQYHLYLHTPLLCLCLDETLAECSGGSGPEEPRNAAAADSGLRGPSGGAAGRAALCRVRPQERRLSSGILTSGPPPPLSSGQSPQRHSDGVATQSLH